MSYPPTLCFKCKCAAHKQPPQCTAKLSAKKDPLLLWIIEQPTTCTKAGQGVEEKLATEDLDQVDVAHKLFEVMESEDDIGLDYFPMESELCEDDVNYFSMESELSEDEDDIELRTRKDSFIVGKGDDTRLGRWKESFKTMLGTVDSVKPFSIAIVPEELRRWNEDAYMPKVVSIGPRYKGAKRDLLQMEEIKWHCMLSLLHRTKHPIESLDKCQDAILKLDTVVRASYVDDIKLDMYELATIMLVDGCFLLELLISASHEWNDELKSSSRFHDLGSVVGRMEEVLSDLILLENQLPLLIIHKLSKLLFRHVFEEEKGHFPINCLVLPLFGYTACSADADSRLVSSKIGHFLELLYMFTFEKSERQEDSQHMSIDVEDVESEEKVEQSDVELKRCATKLQAVGVRIQPLNGEGCDPLPRQYSPHVIVNFDIKFSKDDGKLEIPALHVTETTEAKWRSLIAWEHHKMMLNSSSNARGQKKKRNSSLTADVHCKCTWYALLFRDLICCADDVQLLKDRKIIVDHSKMSNQDLVVFLHSITKGIDPAIIYSNYKKMVLDLNTYSATDVVRQMRIIGWHYYGRQFPKLFCSIYTFLRRDYHFAATFGVLLTFIQTIYAIISYDHRK